MYNLSTLATNVGSGWGFPVPPMINAVPAPVIAVEMILPGPEVPELAAW